MSLHASQRRKITFVRELNADAETDDASEVSTDYESSEWTDIDDEDDGSGIPWDDKDEDPIQQ